MILSKSSRCVCWAHNLDFSPDGRKIKKELMKKKERVVTKFRSTIYEKKLLKIRAKKSGLSLSEFCFRAAFNKDITARLTDEEIEVYKMLSTYSRNFTLIGNMYRKQNPKLTSEVYALAKEIRQHLNNFKK